MLRHAVTALVVIGLAAAITLVFASRGYDVEPWAISDTEDATMAYKRCEELLASLSTKLATALADDAHRAQHFASVLAPAESACTQAEAAIRGADARHPRDVFLGSMRRKVAVGQKWLRDLSTALAAYEVASKQGAADKELAALQALLQ